MAFKLDNIEPSRKIENRSNSTIEELLKKEIVLFGSRFNNKKKQSFYQELAVLLKAGVTIKEGLMLIEESAKKKNDKDLLHQLLEDVLHGKPLSDALLDSGAFSEYEYYSVKIGEETGTVSQICAELNIFFERKNEQRRIVIAALTYPAIVLSTAILVVIFMLNYVVPMFEDIFHQNKMELPALTRIIVALSNAVKTYGIYVLMLIIAFAISSAFLKNNEAYKRIVHYAILRIPIFGKFVTKVNLAQFAQAVALLTASKVPMLNSIQMVRKMIRFRPIQDALSLVEANILQGNSLSASLKQNPLFDNRIISLVKVAEETNQTEYVFKQLSEQYNSEVIRQSKAMTTILEPLIILIVGFLVAVLLIAMYLPMFQMSTALG